MVSLPKNFPVSFRSLSRSASRAAVTASLVLLTSMTLNGLSQAASAQERNARLEEVLHHGHCFGGSGAMYSVQLIEKEGFVQVSNFPADRRKRIVDAIVAARALINYSPTQFTIVAVRYLEPSNSRYFTEVMVSARDITSLSVGTSTMDDLVKNGQLVEVGAGDDATSILNKYLLLAEHQMSEGNYWEAEMLVDAGLRTVGSPPNEQSRLTQDMLTLAEGLDARGDFDRAEKVLKRVLDVRAQNGRLDDADANRTIEHLVELYISDKRFNDAQEMVNRLMANPNLSQSANPTAYTGNLERLGVIHFRNKEYDRALGEFTQVVALKTQQRGEQSPELAIALEELGDTYKAQGQNGEAQARYKQAHAIYDHAVVNKVRADKMDYSIYYAHVKQLDEKLGAR